MGKNKRRYGKRPETFRNYKRKMETTQENASQESMVPEDAVIIDDVNSTPQANEDAEATAAKAVDEESTVLNDKDKEIATLKEQIEKEKKEYMFLMAEFDNFRKRTLKEKSELIKNGSESAFKGLLPIVDDIERAIKAGEKSDDIKTMKEGMDLIYKKLKRYMEQNGVKEMDPEDREFNADRHEAISAVPAPTEDLKGKILDTVEKGYTINDKVLRHAKVVVGQ